MGRHTEVLPLRQVGAKAAQLNRPQTHNSDVELTATRCLLAYISGFQPRLDNVMAISISPEVACQFRVPTQLHFTPRRARSAPHASAAGGRG